MSRTEPIRLIEDFLTWLKKKSRRAGLPVNRIIRKHLENTTLRERNEKFLRHAGRLSGPADLSSRKGFSGR
jgi:hypothetical protein